MVRFSSVSIERERVATYERRKKIVRKKGANVKDMFIASVLSEK